MTPNITTSTVLAFITGVVLIYSAVKKVDPRDVVRKALNKPAKHGFFGAESDSQGFARAIGNNPPGGGGGPPPEFTSNATGNPIIQLPLAPPRI